MRKIKKIILQQTIIPDYRLGLFVLIRKHYSDNFQVIAGDRDFGGTPVSTKTAWEHFRRVRNFYLFNDNFLWQRLIKKELLKADVVILNANIRILSNVILLFLRKLKGRKTLLWGHVDGKSRIASFFRKLYFQLSDGFIAYTETQRKVLLKRNPHLKAWVASNSCVSSVDCVPVKAELQELDSIIYVGRLIKAKKVDLLLKGFIHAKKEYLLPTSVRLIFVGDGELRSSLETFTKEANIMDVVRFAGHISDVCELRKCYRTAICSVSPGYVGLSAIQSFSLGVPMLIAKDENHSPEVEACKEGFNSKFFHSDDVVSLAKELSAFYREKAQWLEHRPLISEWTHKHYSFETMHDAFIQAIDEVSA